MNKETNEIIDLIANKILNHQPSENSSLMSGNSGIALFLFRYSRIRNNTDALNKANELITKSFTDINNGNYYPFFGGGITGTLWVVEYLCENDFIEFDLEEIYEQTDDFLFNSMIDAVKNSNYDYLHGALGITNYFINRKSVKTIEYTNQFVNFLSENIIYINENQGYFKSDIYIREKPFDGVNFSLSHGLASIIFFLQKAIKIPQIKADKSLNMLNCLINYYKSNELDYNHYGNFFPDWLCEDNNSYKSRLAWCYGDLGVGLSLLYASISTNDNDLKEYAINILTKTIDRKDRIKEYVSDAGFCHGASGIYSIYYEIFKLTGINDFKVMGDFWKNQTVSIIHNENPKLESKQKIIEYLKSENNLGLLEGLSGVGMSLLDTIDAKNVNWKKCMMFN